MALDQVSLETWQKNYLRYESTQTVIIRGNTEVTPIQRVPKMGAPKSAQKKVPENVRLKIYQEHGRAL